MILARMISFDRYHLVRGLWLPYSFLGEGWSSAGPQAQPLRWGKRKYCMWLGGEDNRVQNPWDSLISMGGDKAGVAWAM